MRYKLIGSVGFISRQPKPADDIIRIEDRKDGAVIVNRRKYIMKDGCVTVDPAVIDSMSDASFVDTDGTVHPLEPLSGFDREIVMALATDIRDAKEAISALQKAVEQMQADFYPADNGLF